MHAKKEVRQEARAMRLDGMSVRDIAKALGVSKGSVSTWVRDIVLTDAQVEVLKSHQRRYGGQNAGSQTNRKKFQDKRLAFQELGRNKARELRPLHMAGCMLYWAEGAKAKNTVYFVNSDPNMMLFFIRFMREELDVQDTEWAVYIHTHSTSQEEHDRISHYWLDLLRLPQDCLKKIYIKKPGEYRKNMLVNGVCGIAVYRTDLVQHIFGAIQEYAGFDNPAWLF